MFSNGNNVWEVLPREIKGEKTSLCKTILEKLPLGNLMIYVGNERNQ